MSTRDDAAKCIQYQHRTELHGRVISVENTDEIQAQNRTSYNKKRRKATPYRQGDIILIKRTQTGPGLNLCPKFLGHYRVITVLRNDRYVIQKIGEHEGPQTASTAVDNMKPWINNEDSSWSEGNHSDFEYV